MGIIQPMVRFLEKQISFCPPLIRLYMAPYRTVIQREIDLADIGPDDTVLNIGCGAVPFTAIHVARMTQAQVRAVDRDEKAVHKARLLVCAMGLEEYIQVEVGHGEEYLQYPFTVALVALQVVPKEEVWNSLFQQAPSGGRLIFRSPAPKYCTQYDDLPPQYIPSAMVHQPMKTFNRSLLFCKNGS